MPLQFLSFLELSCQVVPLTAAVIVTTPQKLAFIDVAKGVRMFSKLKVWLFGAKSYHMVVHHLHPVDIVWRESTKSFQVPCVAVVENMCRFDADGKRYYPFGRGSGSQACSWSQDFLDFSSMVDYWAPSNAPSILQHVRGEANLVVVTLVFAGR